MTSPTQKKLPPLRRLQVYLRQEDASPRDLAAKTVVLIDVIRATSTLVAALAAGASEARCFATVREVFQAQKRLHKSPLLLCGERNCRRVRGFDLGNSPRDFTPQKCAGRTLLISTTNGTRALGLTHQARQVMLAAFLNLSAIAEQLTRQKGDVLLLCAGTKGHRSEDDVACAGALAEKLDAHFTLSDTARVAIRSWKRMLRAPLKFLRSTEGGRPLLTIGLERDIRDVARRDRTTVIPYVAGRDLGYRILPLAVRGRSASSVRARNFAGDQGAKTQLSWGIKRSLSNVDIRRNACSQPE